MTTASSASTRETTAYRTIAIEGVQIFYREAGPKDAPARRAIQADLVLWRRHDPSFATAGATAYQRDMPGAEINLLDAGYFALDEASDAIAALMRAFFARHGLDGQPGRPNR